MKGKYLFTSFIMISLIMIVSASCGSSKTDKTSQETPVNYTGENINQLLTYTVPDGYHIDTENCTDKNEASYTIILSSDDLDEEVFTLEIISYKKQGVAITDDCDIDMDYLLNVSKDSVIKKITLNDTFTVDGHTCNEVTEYWPYLHPRILYHIFYMLSDSKRSKKRLHLNRHIFKMVIILSE